jgi:hypothetical protein
VLLRSWKKQYPVFQKFIWRCWRTLVSRQAPFKLNWCQKFPGLKNQLSIFSRKVISKKEAAAALWGTRIPFFCQDQKELKDICDSLPSVWRDERKYGILIGPIAYLNCDYYAHFVFHMKQQTLVCKPFPSDSVGKQLKKDEELFGDYSDEHSIKCECENCWSEFVQQNSISQ